LSISYFLATASLVKSCNSINISLRLITKNDLRNINELRIIDAELGNIIFQKMFSSGEIRPVKLIKDHRFYYVNALGIPCVLDLNSKISEAFYSGNIEKIATSNWHLNDEDSTLITTNNNEIYMWNIRNRKLFKRILLIDSSSNFIMDPEGYYAVSKNNFSEILYRRNNIVSSIQQLDLIYNRPAVFINDTSSGRLILKNALEEAYSKRLRRYGLVTQTASYGDLTCNIKNKAEIESFTNYRKLALHIEVTGKNSVINNIHVLDNDIPIFGKNGISTTRGKNIDTTIQFNLTAGNNRVEVFATDNNGLSSNRFPLLIKLANETKGEKLYFIGIGIDHFNNSSHNLNWSVKDIRDLAKAFKEKYGTSCIIDTLFDKEVGTEKIKAIKQLLLGTTENDKVIIAYSGHGLLSDSLDYFLSTYNINFRKPEDGGLPYEVIEDLLDGIPARKKLMLIDACHSGEVDKEEMLKYKRVEDSLRIKGTKGVDILIDSSASVLGMNNSFQLMQELFVDVGRSTGATIISAAAGTQFALEKGDLKNGVFTYSILELMKQKNKSVTISELKKYVNQRVTELTQGMQVPTSRNENKVMDWEVW